MTKHKKIMTAAEMARTLERLAFELIERHEQGCGLALVGIQRRGASWPRGSRASSRQAQVRGAPGQARYQPLPGRLDPFRGPAPGRGSHIPFSLNEKNVVLVDDVLSPGAPSGPPGSHPDYGRPSAWNCSCSSTGAAIANCPSRPTTWAKRSTPPRRTCGCVRGRTRRRGYGLPGALAVAGPTGLMSVSFCGAPDHRGLRRAAGSLAVPRYRLGTFLSDPCGTRRQGICARLAKRRYPCM
jgi:pyrimidine operon attenuation protein/uracil phosphoribosyltransferase